VSIQGNDNNFLYGLAGSYISFAAASNFAVTETGYHTDNFTDGITELAQVICPPSKKPISPVVLTCLFPLTSLG